MSTRKVGGFTAPQRAVRAYVACCLQNDVPWTREAGSQRDPVVWGLLWRYWTTHIGVEANESSNATTEWILTLLLLSAPRVTRARIHVRTDRTLKRGDHAGVARELLVAVALTLAAIELADVNYPSVEYVVASVWNDFCAIFCSADPPLVLTPTFLRALRLLRSETRVEALRIGWIEAETEVEGNTRTRLD